MDGWWPNGLMSVGSLSPFASLPPLPPSLRQMFHTGEKRQRLCLTEWRKAHCTGEKSTLHTALGRKAEWRKPFSGQIATSATTGTPTRIQPIRNELGLLAKLTLLGWQGTGGQEEGFIISLKVLDCVETNTFGKLTKYICQF